MNPLTASNMEKELHELMQILFYCNWQASITVVGRDLAEYCSWAHTTLLNDFFAGDFETLKETYKQYEHKFLEELNNYKD